jgi:hypothetical protein
MNYGLVAVSGRIDLCAGVTDTITLWASESASASCTYQWYHTYFKIVSGSSGYIVDEPISGATHNNLFLSVPSQDKVRTYWCEETCSGNTTATDQVTIYWNEEPEISPYTPSINVCDQTEVPLNISATGYNNYQWSYNRTGLETDWTIIPDALSSSYSFTAKLQDDGILYKCRVYNDCGQTSAVFTVNVKELPELDLGPDTTLCTGMTYTLDAGEGMNAYLWNTDETSQTIEVNTAGLYAVSVTGTNSCMNSDTAIILFNPNLTPVMLGEDTRICLHDSVVLDAGPGYDHFYWSSGDITQQVTIKETGQYWVEVSDDNNVCRERDTVLIEVAEPFSDEKICVVTISQTSGRNVIVWEKTAGKGIEFYNIYRDYPESGNIIATIAFDDLSVFVDTTADPEDRPYLYYLSVIDSCGNESGVSPFHKPHFLQWVSSTGGVNLQWSEYLVGNDTVDFSSYTLYRGSDSTALTSIEEGIPIQVHEYTDDDPQALLLKYYYRVAGELITPCYPTGGEKSGTGPYNHSLSNLDDNRIRGAFVEDILNQQGVFIYPNPMNSRTTIQFLNPSNDKYRLSVIDLSGKIVHSQEDIITDRIEFSRGNLPPGLYMLEIKGPRIYRGKIIIE